MYEAEIKTLEGMGFKHETTTDMYDMGDEIPRIMTVHYLTHPSVPGLFLAHADLSKLLRQIIPATKMLTIMNELKVREVKS